MEVLKRRHAFARALDRHLAGGAEPALQSAYELGRSALADGLGVLDVATLLQEAVLAACRRAPGREPAVLAASSSFVLEVLSPFEMAHRSAREASTALRGLNDFLEEQTRRISRELHDEAGQLLASVHLAVDELAHELPPRAAGRLEAVKARLRDIESQLRRLAHELRPSVLDDLGLAAALTFLAEGVAARSGLTVTMEGVRETPLPGPLAVVLYRIVQEALTNIAKHARASRVSVRLWRQDHRMCCAIRDDGVGFDPAAMATRAGVHGIGLLGIRERLTPLGGTIRVVSAPGRGTELLVTVPAGDVEPVAAALTATSGVAAGP